MELINPIVGMFVALFVKHFVIDFPLQTAYQYKNKGLYGHPGGLVHAGLHVVGSLFVLMIVLGVTPLLIILCLAEGVAHYHIDWAKTRLTDDLRLTPEHNLFWWLLGADQFLHYMTYAAMVLVYFHYFA